MKKYFILPLVMIVLIAASQCLSHNLMFVLSGVCNVAVILLLIIYAHLMDRASWKKD